MNWYSVFSYVCPGITQRSEVWCVLLIALGRDSFCECSFTLWAIRIYQQVHFWLADLLVKLWYFQGGFNHSEWDLVSITHAHNNKAWGETLGKAEPPLNTHQYRHSGIPEFTDPEDQQIWENQTRFTHHRKQPDKAAREKKGHQRLEPNREFTFTCWSELTVRKFC